MRREHCGTPCSWEEAWDSPQRERRQRTQRPESERGWVGRNMQGGYPFSKMQVWKDLLSCWARALMTVSPLPTPCHCLLIWELPNSSEKNFFTSLVFLPVLSGEMMRQGGSKVTQDPPASLFLRIIRETQHWNQKRAQTAPFIGWR